MNSQARFHSRVRDAIMIFYQGECMVATAFTALMVAWSTRARIAGADCATSSNGRWADAGPPRGNKRHNLARLTNRVAYGIRRLADFFLKLAHILLDVSSNLL